MAIAETTDTLAKGLANYLNVNIFELPIMLIFKHHHNEIDKYFLKELITRLDV